MSSQFQNDIPGMGSINDPLSFVKKLWGDMQVPGMVVPTISVDELEKKISDLKTVEAWLNVNMNMLRGTIQALEVQKATLATLKSMGETFAQQMGAAAGAEDSAPFSSENKANAQWPMPPAAAAAAAAKPSAAAEPAAAAKEDASAQFSNPAAWWGLLQDQFKHAVNNAMEGELASQKVKKNGDGKTEGAAKDKAASAKPAAKPAPKADSKAAGKKAAAPAKAKGKRATPE